MCARQCLSLLACGPLIFLPYYSGSGAAIWCSKRRGFAWHLHATVLLVALLASGGQIKYIRPSPVLFYWACLRYDQLLSIITKTADPVTI
jgi:hypothetical protein